MPAVRRTAAFLVLALVLTSLPARVWLCGACPVCGTLHEPILVAYLGEEPQDPTPTAVPPTDGVLDWIAATVDDKTRTVRVRGRVANPKGVLKSGAFGAGTITVDGRRPAVVVPREAVAGNPGTDDVAGFVAEARRRVAAEVSLPPGYRVEWGGSFESLRRFQERMAVVVPLATVVIGGVISSTLLTLLVLPAVYVLFDRDVGESLRAESPPVATGGLAAEPSLTAPSPGTAAPPSASAPTGTPDRSGSAAAGG